MKSYILQKIAEREKLKVLIKFLGPISKDDLEVEIKSSKELKEILKNTIDKEWLDKVAIAVNDNIVSDFDNIKDGDIISVLPPVCGG